MTRELTSYDGSITAHPRRLVSPQTIEEIVRVLRDCEEFPSPVRAMGSFHSMTPCSASDGTILDMTRMNRIIDIDPHKMTITAGAGLQLIEASRALRAQGLQFFANIEIGNATVAAAACGHTKDGLDCAQMCTTVTGIKWVTPTGALAEATEADSPDLLRLARSMHGLCGVIYQVTFRVKPLEVIRLTYLPRPVAKLTQDEVNDIMARSQGLMCWTVGDTAVFQTRSKTEKASALTPLSARVRRSLWSYTGPHATGWIDQHTRSGSRARGLGRNLFFSTCRAIYGAVHLAGGIRIYNPDKIIDYGKTPPASRFSFSFWGFPARQWLNVFRDYRTFADRHFDKYGFRCNCPVVSYHLLKDDSSILSHTADGNVMTIDPLHVCRGEKTDWYNFLHEFNEFAYQHKGIPLLTQTPLLKKQYVVAAYGERWREFSDWVRRMDPDRRMLNPFFADLLE